MGRQIITQPNGKYCIYSTIVDNITHFDMTVDDIIEEWVKPTKDEITCTVKHIVSELENGKKPYYQFTKSYDEVIKLIEQVHGKEERDKIKSLIENTNNI